MVPGLLCQHCLRLLSETACSSLLGAGCRTLPAFLRVVRSSSREGLPLDHESTLHSSGSFRTRLVFRGPQRSCHFSIIELEDCVIGRGRYGQSAAAHSSCPLRMTDNRVQSSSLEGHGRSP